MPAETPFGDPASPEPAGLDVLSDVLRVFHTTGAALLRGEFAEPWAVDMPHGNDVAAVLHTKMTKVVMFHIVAEGGCWVDIEGEPRVWLGRGDMIGFPLGHQHIMGAGEGASAVRLGSLLPPPPWMDMPLVKLGTDGPLTQMICIYLHCDKLLFNPILPDLPVQIVVRPQNETGTWIDATLRFIVAESMAARQGSSDVIARLTELLFIEILRQHITTASNGTGWLAALGERHVAKALQALHANPKHRWTVAELSRQSACHARPWWRAFTDFSPKRQCPIWRIGAFSLPPDPCKAATRASPMLPPKSVMNQRTPSAGPSAATQAYRPEHGGARPPRRLRERRYPCWGAPMLDRSRKMAMTSQMCCGSGKWHYEEN